MRWISVKSCVTCGKFHMTDVLNTSSTDEHGVYRFRCLTVYIESRAVHFRHSRMQTQMYRAFQVNIILDFDIQTKSWEK